MIKKKIYSLLKKLLLIYLYFFTAGVKFKYLKGLNFKKKLILIIMKKNKNLIFKKRFL